ncbi:MAG: PIN domain nuclease [Gammaproteobacteria bacterium]|nr:PIN domain nuclease [Gammaproteobacteria bacterium]
MILVDSGVWIDYFNGVENKQTTTLNDMLGVRPVAVGDLILAEVLQGFREDKEYKTAKSLFNELVIFDLLGKDMAIKSADNFRSLRKRGITIRKTVDIIIASFCIERKIPLLFSDKDFKPFVKTLGLIAA